MFNHDSAYTPIPWVPWVLWKFGLSCYPKYQVDSNIVILNFIKNKSLSVKEFNAQIISAVSETSGKSLSGLYLRNCKAYEVDTWLVHWLGGVGVQRHGMTLN